MLMNIVLNYSWYLPIAHYVKWDASKLKYLYFSSPLFYINNFLFIIIVYPLTAN